MTSILILLSIFTTALVFGHFVSILLNRPLYPFANYPMYSYPLKKMSYPVVAGEKLILLTLLDSTSGMDTDLIKGKLRYPPAFMPLDRLEVIVLIAKAMRSSAESPFFSENAENHFKLSDKDRKLLNQPVEAVMKDLLKYANFNKPDVKKLKLVMLEWDSFMNLSVNPDHPTRTNVICEVGLD